MMMFRTCFPLGNVREMNAFLFLSAQSHGKKSVERHRTIKQNSQRWESCALPTEKSHAVSSEEDVCIANSSLAGDRTGFQTALFPDVM